MEEPGRPATTPRPENPCPQNSSSAPADKLRRWIQAYSALISFAIVLVLTPSIAIATKGRFYIARVDPYLDQRDTARTETCIVCHDEFEVNDMTYCPFHDGPICSLCCVLESSCHAVCKSEVLLQAPRSRQPELARSEAANHRTALG